MKIWPKRWVSTALVLFVILYFTLVPRPLPDTNIEIPGLDKLIHIIMFGAFAFVCYIDWARRERHNFRTNSFFIAARIFKITCCLGLTIELAQHFMEIGRSGEFWDYIADVAGAFIGTYLAAMAIRTWHKQQKDLIEKSDNR